MTRLADPPEPSSALVRDELALILASDLFARSDRLSSFLRFIVERTIDGQGDGLKEQVIAFELYRKSADFNTASDPIVRVDARRLRDKLREYYASAPGDLVVISVPKGSYTPVFAFNPSAAALHLGEHALEIPAADATVLPVASKRRRQFAIAAVFIALSGSVVWVGIRRANSPPPVRLITATAFPGLESGASFSPDGDFIAFTWSGPDDLALGDLWVKPVEGDTMRRLTDTPANEVWPSWSPDGRLIAFARAEGERNVGIYVMSPLGGAERKVMDYGWRPTWTPDSKSLVVDAPTETGAMALFQQVLETGERRQVTTPPAGFGDHWPSVSRDGRRVAFIRGSDQRQGQAALFVAGMSGGEAVRVDAWVRSAGFPDWTPDGREIIYPRNDASGLRIFRVTAPGGSAVPAAGLPSEGNYVSVSGFRRGGTFRVAVTESKSDVGMRMVDLRRPLSEGRIMEWTPFYDSTRSDWPGRFSRDGTRVSFTSNRDGPMKVYAAARDGSGMRPLTGANDISTGFASWSPDGLSLVFDAVAPDTARDLFVVGASGAPTRRLTHDAHREADPEWSRDGRWIYYTSDASGRREIFKIPAGGGAAIQLTTTGGFEPRESPDGTGVYYLEPIRNAYATTTLKRVGVDGQGEQTIVPGVWPGAWDVADEGIVFLTGARGIAPGGQPFVVQMYGFRDQRVRSLGELPFPVMPRGYSPPRVLTVSPDGRWAIVSHRDDWHRDIIVADNFR